MLQRLWKDWVWTLFFISSITGITLMITFIFVTPSNEFSHHNKERIILWFYFTFQSNVLGLIISVIRFIENIRGIEHKKYHILRLMATTSLVVTFIVYWAYLFPQNPYSEPFNLIKTLFVHGFTPIMALTTFLYSNIKLKESIKSNPWKVSLFSSIYPAIWMLVAVIIYFSLGANSDSAIYSFLNFSHNAAWVFPVFFFGIGSLYFFTSVLLQVIENKIAIKQK